MNLVLAAFFIAVLGQFGVATVSRRLLFVPSAVVIAACLAVAGAALSGLGWEVGECAQLSSAEARAILAMIAALLVAVSGLAGYATYAAMRGRSPMKPLWAELVALGAVGFLFAWVAGGTSC